MRLYYFLLELLFPSRCCLCRKLLKKQETDLCARCRTETPGYPNGKRKLRFLDSFAAVWYYEGSVRTSLLRYKFHGARSYAAVYGRLLAMKLQQSHPEGFEVLAWVPVSTLRRLRRGYDQVELVAHVLGRELGLVPAPVFKKIRHTPRQSGIREDARRRANVLGVYAVTDPERVRGKRVLLLDDILTSGATLEEAGRMLRMSGAKEVHGAAIAAARKR